MDVSNNIMIAYLTLTNNNYIIYDVNIRCSPLEERERERWRVK